MSHSLLCSRPGDIVSARGILLMRVQITILRLSTLCLVSLIAVIAGFESRSPAQATLAPVRAPGSTIYYLDSSAGNDANSGTSPADAWKSLERVNNTVFAPGNRILFKAGSRFEGRLNPRGSGAEGSPVVVDSYGEGEKPLIEAEGKYNEALLLKNQQYWEVNNLALTNTGSTRQTFRFGVRIMAWDFGTMRHIHLRNLFIHDVNGSLIKEDQGEGHGVVWENGGQRKASRFDDLLIEGCRLLRTDRNGICGYSENSDRSNWFPSLHVVIRNNLLEDIGGDGIKVWGCEDALVEHNRLYKGGQRAPDYSAGIWPWSSDGTIFQFNEVSEFKGTRDGQAFDSDGNCRGTVFQYNYSHDNDGGFMLICSSGGWTPPRMIPNTGTVVRYNVSQNDRARTFHISGPVRDVLIYNNVFFIGKGLDIPVFLFTDWDGWSQGAFAANNIFYAEGTARYSHSVGRNPDGTYRDAPGFGQSRNNIFENSVYYGNQLNPPADPKAITADPMMASPGTGRDGFSTLDGYKLKAGSPCIGAGKVIARNGGRDFWGNKVPDAKPPCIGANER
jgi:hypothetical protein